MTVHAAVTANAVMSLTTTFSGWVPNGLLVYAGCSWTTGLWTVRTSCLRSHSISLNWGNWCVSRCGTSGVSLTRWVASSAIPSCSVSFPISSSLRLGRLCCYINGTWGVFIGVTETVSFGCWRPSTGSTVARSASVCRRTTAWMSGAVSFGKSPLNVSSI